MHILLINGSPRKTGATAKILSAFEAQLQQYAGVHTTLVHVSDLEIGFCKGCCRCYRTCQCFMQDDAEALSRKIAQADGLVIGSPNFVSGVHGQLKAFIDRGHFVIEQLLKNVHTIGVVTYENADGRAVRKALRKLFVLSGAKHAGDMMVKLPFNQDPMESERIQRQVGVRCRRLYDGIQKGAPGGAWNRLLHAAAFRFGIRPFVRKKGEAFQGVLEHWKERGILNV